MRVALMFKNAVAALASLSLMVPPSLAQQIVGDGASTAPQVMTTANGLPMVIITTPNSAGVSHNTYTSFNVGTGGAILNNVAANTGLTQQAGLVQGNANLGGGTASLIINEVTVNNPSTLNGYLEVAGARADVIVANPYGISCNGCGFINTDRATLTTGAPVFAGSALGGFSVNGGTIAIGELGADARGVGTFDLISQRVTFAGAVHGERVRVLAGRNDVIYATGAAAAKAPNGTEPDLAIDSTVLGGMYANAITIQSTDQGAGVKAPATMAANAGEMRITADGKLVIGRAASSGQLTAQARDIEVETSVNGQQGVSLAALRDLTLKADAMIVSQAAIALSAGNSVALRARSKVQSASSVNVQSTAATTLGEQASLLAQGNLAVTAGSFDAAKQATIIAGLQDASGTSQAASLNLDITGAATLAQSSLMSSGGMTFDAGSITVDADPLLPASRFVALGAMTVSAGTIDFGHAALHAEGALTLTATQGLSFAQNADVFSRGNLTLGAADIDIQGGEFLSAGQIAMGSQSLDIAAAGRVQSAQSLTLTGSAAAVAGDLVADVVSVTMSGNSSFSGDTFGQTSVDIAAANLTLSGSVKSLGDVTVAAEAITQTGAVQAGDLIDFKTRSGNMGLSGSLLAANFALTAAGDIQSSALILDNRALAIAHSAATLPAAGTFTVTARNFTNLAAGAVRLGTAATFDLAAQFSNAGDIVALSDLTVTADTGLQNSGRMLAVNDLSLTSAQLDNLAAGKIEGATLTLIAPILTNAGAIAATNTATVSASASVTNSGTVKVTNRLGITTQSLMNSGTLQTDTAALAITANSFDNTGGTVKSGFGVAIATASALTFGAGTGGAILSDDYIQLGGVNGAAMGALTIANTGQLVATGDLSLHVAQLHNQGTLASGTGNLALRSAGDVANSGLIYAGAILALGSGGAVVNNAGTIMAATDLVICGYDLTACLANPATSKAASLRNMNGGQIETLGGNMILAANTISNERDVEFVAGVPQSVSSAERNTGEDGCYFNFFGCQHWWWMSAIDTTTTTVDSIRINGPNSQIVSSANLTIVAGNFQNSYGLVSARQNMNLSASSVTNLGASAHRTTVTRSDIFFNRRTSLGGGDRYLDRTITGGTTSTVIGTASGRIEAGGTISGTITGTLSNVLGNTSNLEADLDVAPTLPDTEANTSSASATDPVPADPAALLGAASLAPTVVSLPSGGTISTGAIDLANLSNDQLFKINAPSRGGYLIETRHSFIDLSAFMSSDYFLGELNFDPDITQRRLGDAMVETLAVRNQLQQLTGGTILQSGISEREQMQAMYQNGIDAARALNLTPGVALNPTQIAALTNSMIWLEEQTISGQRVLVPTVYLASSAGSGADGGGAMIRGNTIALNTGNVTNSGGISATNGLTLLASGNITNSFGSISAGTDLKLLANNGTFSNLSGAISGRNVSISAGTVSIETTSRALDWQYGSTTVAGPTASITATNNLSITGLAGIDIVGAALSGGAGVALSSQGDITISSVALNDSFAIRNGNNASERESTRFLASSITSAAGNLTIAGGNITITGANLSANSTIGLTATGAVQLLADTQTDYSYQFSQRSGWFSSSTYRDESFTATSIGTSLNGGAIAITADGDITTQAAQLTASTGQIGVTSTTGNIALLAAVDIRASYSHSSNSFLGGLFSNSSTTERLNTTIAANDLNAKTLISVSAAQDLTSVGGTMVAGGDVTLVAGETVTLAGAVRTDYTSTKSNKNSGFFIVDKTEVSLTQSADFTSITAGGEVEVSGAQVVANLDQTSAAFGLNAKSLIGIDEATSQTRLYEHLRPKDPSLFSALTQGGADQPSQGASTAGSSDNPAYNFAGSTVNIGVPTALDDAGYAYLDVLNASGQLTVEEMKLVQHQFYDQKVQLSPAFKVLLAAAVSWSGVGAAMGNSLLSSLGIQGAYATTALGAVQASTWLGHAATAFMGSLTTGVLEGGLTGNFNLGQILEGATFSAVSAGLVASVDLDTFGIKLGEGASKPLWSVGSGNLTLSAVLEKGVDSALTAGLSSAVYGTDFGAGFGQAWGQATLSLARNDLQNDIGANFASGSAGSWGSHLLLGCGFASATGADCAAGMVGAATEQLFVASLGGPRPPVGTPEYEAWKAQNANDLALIAATVGFVFSGGKAENVSASADYAGSAFENNYLTREQWRQFNADVQACGGDKACAEDILREYEELSDAQNKAFFDCIAAGDMDCIQDVYDELAKVEDAKNNILYAISLSNSDLGNALNFKTLLDQDQTAIAATEIVYGDGNRITPQQAQDIFAIDRALLCTGGMSTGDCLAAIATARSERGIEGTLLMADMIPFVGTGKGLAECIAELSVSTCGGALLSVVPGAGGVVKVILKKGDEFVEFTADGKKILSQKRGTTGDWNKDLNKPQPNKVYPLDNGDVYVTDDLGRVSTVKADLSHDPNARNGYQQRIAGGECRLPSDCGGHLIAAVFGGAGEAINLVPMDKTLNGVGGEWYKLEKQWMAALGAGKNVKVDIQPVYSGSSTRPDSFVVKYEVDGDEVILPPLYNTPTGFP